MTSPPADGEPFATWVRAVRGQHPWVVVWLRPEATIDEGSFVLEGEHTQDGQTYPVAVYHPGRDGTHTPLGEVELAERGLREAMPHPDEHGDMPS